MALGGRGVLERYNNSPSLLLAEIYPEIDWMQWRFDRCQRGFWDNAKNRKKFMEYAKKELKIKEMSDWYSVSFNVKKYFSPSYFFRIFLNLAGIL
jgi:hypothetical protein